MSKAHLMSVRIADIANLQLDVQRQSVLQQTGRDDVSEAIEVTASRWRRGYPRYCTGKASLGNPWLTSQEEIADALTLANACVAQLAAREAAERERALPIDPAWLLTVGAVEWDKDDVLSRYSWFAIGPKNNMALHLKGWGSTALGWSSWCFALQSQDILNPVNRGDVLDMLAALQIQIKATEVAP